MKSVLLEERLSKSFAIYEELANHLEHSAFVSKLASLPSNTIGEQLWCVVGARESYMRGIQKGQWDGFRCSLSKEAITRKKDIIEAPINSASTARLILSQITDLTAAQEKLAFDLLEHEVQHQGQLIRYLYGLKLGIPVSLKERYHLD